MNKVLEMSHISKRFPGVLALDDVNLTLHSGEVLGLLGENGAGKSTLMKILSGAYVPDAGEIRIDGQRVSDADPVAMHKMGVAVVYQELSYLDNISVAENIYLGRTPKNQFHLVDYKRLYADTEKLLENVGLNVDPSVNVEYLSTAEKQLVEVAKVLSYQGKVLVFDEPTSALSEKEVERLFLLIKKFAAQGMGVIYITHKMDELFGICDRIQVLRDGKDVGCRMAKDTSMPELISMMVGRTIKDMYPKENVEKGAPVLTVEHLSGDRIHDVSFQVHAGEVVGLFGLMGSGRTEIAESIFGKRAIHSGGISINGKAVKIGSPRQAIKEGLAYVPRERKTESLLGEMSVKENITIACLKALRKSFILNLKKEADLATKWSQILNIKAPSIHSEISSLSGGNQQKTVIARWMVTNCKALILNEPTRGIDVGAKVEIYRLIDDLCKKGIAILMISSEIPEIMNISDRIVVVHDGCVKGTCLRKDFSQERLMSLVYEGEHENAK